MPVTNEAEKSLAKLQNFLGKLARGEAGRAVHLMVKQAAAKTQESIVDRYLDLMRAQQRKQIGLLSRDLGKAQGVVRPARLPRPSTSTFNMLAFATVLKQIGKGHWRIAIDPSKKHPDPSQRDASGSPLALMAWWIENRVSAVWPVTLRMAVYLRMLMEGKAGYGKGGNAPGIINNIPLGRFILFRYEDKPVWRYVAERIEKTVKGSSNVYTTYMKQLAAQGGAKVI